MLAQVQFKWDKRKIVVPETVCYGSGEIEKIYIPPPKEFLLKSGEKKSDIIVTYSLFPEEAKVAFEYAVSIWESIIESPIPISVQANWRTQDNNVLGSASPSEYISDFENIPHKNRFYPISVAEKIAKSEINPTSSPDINATFNKGIKWYYGIDGETPDEMYDFVTVVLHEIGHGLGFTGFFYVSNNTGTYFYDEIGDATSFDLMVLDLYYKQLVDTTIFKVPSKELYNALTSGLLYSNSPVATNNNNGNNPKLYTPTNWSDGSSVYHLNDATYRPGSGNSLMTHAIGKGEAVHDPGPITKGIIADIGWKNMFLDLDKPKDIEQKKPIAFNLSVESDYELDTTSLYLFYSYLNKTDSMLLVPSENGKYFSAILLPEINEGEILYYITATDVQNRTFSLPSEAPVEYYSIKIGPDNEAPNIVHSPIPYFILENENLKITTFADDNLGVDTVYIDYEINGVQQNSFGLTLDSAATYSAYFNFNLAELNDGDEITYRITAIDSSLAKNSTVSPETDSYTFKVEKIFDPIVSYYNNFNNPTPDFIFSDFEVYTEPGFNNAALQSPHPYPSPNKNNTNWNFTTLFKYPIVLQENATLNFDEIVLVEPGEILANFGDDEFWDYVIVEGSKDKGETWQQLAKGYDSGTYPIWKTNYNKNIVDQISTTTPIPDWYFNREINMLSNGNFDVGDTILIQFRLFSDPYAHGWGWTIDNLRIQQPVSSPQNVLGPTNVMVYPNPVNDIVNVSFQSHKTFDKLSFEVSNLHGQKMLLVQVTGNGGEINQVLDLSNLVSGMYFLTINENGNTLYSKKIIKN